MTKRNVLSIFRPIILSLYTISIGSQSKLSTVRTSFLILSTDQINIKIYLYPIRVVFL
jgi:hypothetical protein